MSEQAIREIEQVAMRAWPALEAFVYDGWVLRYGKGYTRRNNSVNALLSSTLPLEEKIGHCEAWYQKWGVPCTFRLTSAFEPKNLEDVLAEHGYRYQDDTLVQTLALQGDQQQHPLFRFENTLKPDWLAAYMHMNRVDSKHKEALVQMLRSIALPSCFAWLGDFAVGLAVHDGEFVGLFDIVVAEDQRGNGYGRALVTSLLSWGVVQGAKTAYLQVVTTNKPARNLYESLGFRTHHRYWYWAKG